MECLGDLLLVGLAVVASAPGSLTRVSVVACAIDFFAGFAPVRRAVEKDGLAAAQARKDVLGVAAERCW
jgi:hypothetical protein